MKPVDLSIITISFNAQDTISRCLESVARIKQESIEYIVIDGGSTDNTLEILHKYKNVIDVLVSETDDGIYDAWNKGLRHSTGAFIMFLNADDWLPSDAFTSFEFSALDSAAIYIGKTALYKGSIFTREVDGGFILEDVHRGFGFLTPCVLFSRKSFTEVGYFNTSYAIAGDVDWLLRAALKSVKFHRLHHLVNMSLEGVSNTRLFLSLAEYNKALRSNGLYGLRARMWAFRKMIVLVVRRIASYL